MLVRSLFRWWCLWLVPWCLGCPRTPAPSSAPSKTATPYQSASPGAYESYVRAILAEEEGRPAEALALLVDALAYDPRDAYLNARAAALALSLGDLARAELYGARALKLAPKRADAALTWAELAAAQGDPAEARRRYTYAHTLHPEDRAISLSFGAFLLAREEVSAAEAILRRVPAHDAEGRAAGLRLLALDAARRGESARAERLWRERLTVQPGDDEATLALARLLLHAGRPAEALAVLVESASHAAPSEEVLLAGVSASLRVGDRLARASFVEPLVALAQRRHDPAPMRRLAALYLDAGEPREALPALVEALSVSASDAGVYLLLGRCYAALREWPRAKESLSRADALAPKQPETLLLLGEASAALGQREEAQGFYREALSLSRDESLRQVVEERLRALGG